MAKIKIQDLPKDMKISKEELKRIKGGTFDLYSTSIAMKMESTLDIGEDVDFQGKTVDNLKL
ncbi:MAG: hypothetical protein JW932_10390 [Deltaproteobacteria bacterium]|nr:hypothetical protein [Deltaproteobacteria bacterium]